MPHEAPGFCSRWPILMTVVLVMAPLMAVPAHAHMRGMYATKAEAEKRAAQLKCKGAFVMGAMWMPCATERALRLEPSMEPSSR